MASLEAPVATNTGCLGSNVLRTGAMMTAFLRLVNALFSLTVYTKGKFLVDYVNGFAMPEQVLISLR